MSTSYFYMTSRFALPFTDAYYYTFILLYICKPITGTVFQPRRDIHGLHIFLSNTKKEHEFSQEKTSKKQSRYAKCTYRSSKLRFIHLSVMCYAPLRCAFCRLYPFYMQQKPADVAAGSCTLQEGEQFPYINEDKQCRHGEDRRQHHLTGGQLAVSVHGLRHRVA